MSVLSHVRGDGTVVSRLCRIRRTLLLALELMMHPSKLITHLVVLLVKQVNFVAQLFVLVATGAAVLVEVADVIGCCHDY